MKKNIVVVGCGFVGLSNAVLLAKHNNVTAVDIDIEKINLLKNKQIPFKDNLLQEQIKNNELNLHFKSKFNYKSRNIDYLFISTPTNYNEETNHFDTSHVESVIKELYQSNYKGHVIIKSTIPVGFTQSMSKKYKDLNLFFSPEFLRETTALEDNLNPDRIIVSGIDKDECHNIGELLKRNTNNNPDILITDYNEAESIKLFSNTYLAMRVAFFNELDSFAMKHELDTKSIIDGVSKDKRIGTFYNNPSFGYGGYCLPKDTKQLLSNYEGIQNNIIHAIVLANKTRKDNIVNDILNKVDSSDTIGIHRLIMKEGSDNFRDSSILGIIKRLKEKGMNVIIYEPNIKENNYYNSPVNKDIDDFKDKCDLIICNRYTKELEGTRSKIYTRDIYHSN